MIFSSSRTHGRAGAIALPFVSLSGWWFTLSSGVVTATEKRSAEIYPSTTVPTTDNKNVITLVI